MKCNHDLAERETACADGMCPICLSEKIEGLKEGIKLALDLIDSPYETFYGKIFDVKLKLKKLLKETK